MGSIGKQIIEQKFSHCCFSETCVGPANNRVYQSGAAFDINNAVVANIGACERKCEMTAFCKGFSYRTTDKRCFLKKALGALRKRTNFISYSCTPGVSEITGGKLELIAVVPKFTELEKFF